MLWTILVVLLLLSLIGGGFGTPYVGYYSWSPLGLILVILIVLLVLGRL